MSVKIPISLTSSADTRTLVDAIYYLVRVLRNSRRGFKNAAISPESTPKAYRLADSALKEIEQGEGKRIAALSTDQVDDYITSLEELQRSTYSKAVGTDEGSATRVLEEMRALRA